MKRVKMRIPKTDLTKVKGPNPPSTVTNNNNNNNPHAQTPAPTREQHLIQAYRHLYRRSLQAVAHSQPASTLARNLLRAAFRDKDGGTFDQEACKRTSWFLHNAARESGVEHRIVKNLLMCKFWKDYQAYVQRPTWPQIVDMNNSQGRHARRP